MDALVDDPKVPFEELLGSTGLSPKTLHKNLDLLLERKIISIDPLMCGLGESIIIETTCCLQGRRLISQMVNKRNNILLLCIFSIYFKNAKPKKITREDFLLDRSHKIGATFCNRNAHPQDNPGFRNCRLKRAPVIGLIANGNVCFSHTPALI